MNVSGRFISAIAWLGTVLQISGAGGMASRLSTPVDAYWIMLEGSLLWCFLAAQRRDWPLLAMQATFAALNVIGIVRWVG